MPQTERLASTERSEIIIDTDTELFISREHSTMSKSALRKHYLAKGKLRPLPKNFLQKVHGLRRTAIDRRWYRIAAHRQRQRGDGLLNTWKRASKCGYLRYRCLSYTLCLCSTRHLAKRALPERVSRMKKRIQRHHLAFRCFKLARVPAGAQMV